MGLKLAKALANVVEEVPPRADPAVDVRVGAVHAEDACAKQSADLPVPQPLAERGHIPPSARGSARRGEARVGVQAARVLPPRNIHVPIEAAAVGQLLDELGRLRPKRPERHVIRARLPDGRYHKAGLLHRRREHKSLLDQAHVQHAICQDTFGEAAARFGKVLVEELGP